jgi:predicted nucleotidyltransferase
MDKDATLKLLNKHGPEIRKRFGVKRLALFGSVARGDAGVDSDVDVLVEFEGRATFDGYMDLKLYLEDLLERNVDLVTNDAVRPQTRPSIEQDLVDVA